MTTKPPWTLEEQTLFKVLGLMLLLWVGWSWQVGALVALLLACTAWMWFQFKVGRIGFIICAAGGFVVCCFVMFQSGVSFSLLLVSFLLVSDWLALLLDVPHAFCSLENCANPRLATIDYCYVHRRWASNKALQTDRDAPGG